MTLQMDLDGGVLPYEEKLRILEVKKVKKIKKKTKYKSCGVPTIANKTIYSMFCIVVIFFFKVFFYLKIY